MSAQEGLGRLFNVVPIASTKAISLKGAAGVTFVTTGSDTFTLTCSDVFGGSYASPGTIAANVYKNTATDGTAVWALDNTLISTNTIVTTVATAFYISGVFLPDGKAYVKLTASGAGLVTAIVHDLLIKRTPPNLAKLGA